jgi:hypothetical protein
MASLGWLIVEIIRWNTSDVCAILINHISVALRFTVSNSLIPIRSSPILYTDWFHETSSIIARVFHFTVVHTTSQVWYKKLQLAMKARNIALLYTENLATWLPVYRPPMREHWRSTLDSPKDDLLGVRKYCVSTVRDSDWLRMSILNLRHYFVFRILNQESWPEISHFNT